MWRWGVRLRCMKRRLTIRVGKVLVILLLTHRLAQGLISLMVGGGWISLVDAFNQPQIGLALFIMGFLPFLLPTTALITTIVSVFLTIIDYNNNYYGYG